MGFAIGIGNGLHLRGNIVATDAQIYVRAAEAAGGTVESPSCVKASFQAFKVVKLSMYAETQNYVTAAEAEGGTVESFSCIRKDFTTLNNITL